MEIILSLRFYRAKLHKHIFWDFYNVSYIVCFIWLTFKQNVFFALFITITSVFFYITILKDIMRKKGLSPVYKIFNCFISVIKMDTFIIMSLSFYDNTQNTPKLQADCDEMDRDVNGAWIRRVGSMALQGSCWEDQELPCGNECCLGQVEVRFRGDDSTLQVGFGYNVKPLEFRIQ